MGNVPVFEWKADTIPVILPSTDESPQVRVWLYSNDSEYNKFYQYFRA